MKKLLFILASIPLIASGADVFNVLDTTTFNGNTWTTGTGTLTIAAGKTLTANNTLTMTGTDSSSVAFGTGGTATYTANKLSVFAATTSAELAGVLSDESGTGVVCYTVSCQMTTPSIGVASGTSLNATGSVTSTSSVINGATDTTIFAAYGPSPTYSFKWLDQSNNARAQIDSNGGNLDLLTINQNNPAAGGASLAVHHAGGTASIITTGTNESLYITPNGTGKVIAPTINATTSVQTGTSTLTLTTGAIGMSKMTASGSAPGAGGAKLELVCGTNAGTAKLVISAGTSATTVTVIDNIGAGVTGC